MRNWKSSLFPWILFEEREDIRGEDGIRFPMLDTFLPCIGYPLFPLLSILLSEIGLNKGEETGGEKSPPNIVTEPFTSSSPVFISCPSQGITLIEMKKSEILFTSFWAHSEDQANLIP